MTSARLLSLDYACMITRARVKNVLRGKRVVTSRHTGWHGRGQTSVRRYVQRRRACRTIVVTRSRHKNAKPAETYATYYHVRPPPRYLLIVTVSVETTP